jgi:hypothetical protein
MSSEPIPEPGCGRPCERVIPQMLFEVARVRARGERSCVPPCTFCRAGNTIVLGRGTDPSLCYRHRVRPRETHHPKTGHVGPEIPGTDANEHRVISEVERIWARVCVPGLCSDCALGLNRFLAVRLTSLGSLGDVA